MKDPERGKLTTVDSPVLVLNEGGTVDHHSRTLQRNQTANKSLEELLVLLGSCESTQNAKLPKI